VVLRDGLVVQFFWVNVEEWEMKSITPSDLKSILHSKRANLYYLEHCRILVNGGRVEYVTEEGNKSLYWNIPIANTTSILLGTGTSITQAAMRELAKAGVLVGFCGGGGTPLFTANEVDVEVAWFSPQSEYRPTEYLQAWVGFWFDDGKRLEAAKTFQRLRIAQIEKLWTNKRSPDRDGFSIDSAMLHKALDEARSSIEAAVDSNALLTQEARLTKELFKLAARDHGNYLAYGLGATAAWVLGLPHGLAVLHGKTRRGGLVFDIADLVKDSLILPQAFVSAMQGDDDQQFRQACIDSLTQYEALDFMIDTVKSVAKKIGGVNE
jgi:CRISPR-associated protein Cas1